MIKFSALRQYVHVTDGIRFYNEPGKNYVLTYFSENSTLLDDYPKLNFKLVDAKINVVPLTLIPRTRLTLPLTKEFKRYGIYTYSSTMKVPTKKNVFYDTTVFCSAIDDTFHPAHYRQRLRYFITGIVDRSFSTFPDFQKVLIYSIDLSKPFNPFVDRRFFPILQQMKDGEFSFDHLVLCLITPNGARYRLLVKDKKYNFQRIFTYLKTIRQNGYKELTPEEEDVEETENQEITTKVMNQIQDNISPDTKHKVTDAVKTYLQKDPITKERISSNNLTKRNMQKIGTAAILYKVSGDLKKSVQIANSTPKKDTGKILSVVDKRYSDQILHSEKPVNTSTQPLVKSYDVPRAVSYKSPSHLFQKRIIDFQTNLKTDLTRSFAVLENKEIPLSVSKMEITDKHQKPGEIAKSDISILKVSIKDNDGKTHPLTIDIPKIDPKSGTFTLNGQKKCLINQIILCPISFPKKYESRFESSYSVFRIRSKKLRKTQYLEIFIANSWLPFSVLLFYSFGLNETLKQYGITYQISQDKPSKNEEFSVKINDKDYMYFGNVKTELQKELVKSFIMIKLNSFNIEKPFGTTEYFNDLIIGMTGKVSSTFLIVSTLENIVDPVVTQVLINQQLPHKLQDIMYYMSSKLIDGYVQDRNDLSNQRIRGSEVLVYLIQKQILAAYTDYKGKRLAGNKDAKFEIPRGKLLSDFSTSEIVAHMEYANPIEEMAVMTRVSPLGKKIGGIPSDQALQNEARNIHPSYYGNIDPLDTPEGGSVGISQQLAIGAFVTSARGLFHKKDFNNSEKPGILSTSSSMIPFIENNDGARILMATQQAKQMLPLKNPEPPIIRSGYESLLTNYLSDSFIKKSPIYGKVFKITIDEIVIVGKSKKESVSIIPAHLKSGSGKNTLSVFKPVVKVGQVVQEGQIIAEGGCVEGGSISLGRTLCVAVMPYKGYDFEDGIVINERLVNEDKLTSIHGIIEDVYVSENDRVLEIAKIGEYIEKGKPLLRKTIGEIEQLIGYSDVEGEEKIGQQSIRKSQGGTVVDIDVFSNVDDSKFPLLKDLIQRTRKKYKTPSTEKFLVKGVKIDGILISFKIEQELKIKQGDKLCNRYGAKGIVCLIEKNENMPRTPWGEHVDIIVNPIGIIGRSNIGQLYELYCGLIARDIGTRISSFKTKSQVLNLIKKVYSILDSSNNKEFTNRLIANLNSMSQKEFNILINRIKTTGFSPIIIPPFQAPSMEQIKEALKLLGLKAGYPLFLSEYSVKTKNNVPVGYMYFSKLEHIAEEKIYGRSTGPVRGTTLQPTSGKKQEGAQRLGEADTYSMISYNCPVTLSEMMGPLSDDLTTKNEIIAEIIQTGTAKYKDTKISPAKDMLNSYFIALMLEKS
jgi:DNA-directed RNA polymerase beta subunit